MEQTRIPIKLFKKPDGESQSGFIPYSKDEALEAKYNEIERNGIFITAEDTMGLVNICFDTGEFDYEFQLYSKTELQDKLYDLIMGFDQDEFEKAVNAYRRSEIQESDEYAEQVANEEATSE